MVIAFWNIDKNERKKANQDFSDVLIDFVMEQGVDILLLAEANNKTVLNFIKKSQRILSPRSFKQILGSKVEEALPIAAYIATGVEITNAHGQAITKSVIACCNQWFRSSLSMNTGIAKSSVANTIMVGV